MQDPDNDDIFKRAEQNARASDAQNEAFFRVIMFYLIVLGAVLFVCARISMGSSSACQVIDFRVVKMLWPPNLRLSGGGSLSGDGLCKLQIVNSAASCLAAPLLFLAVYYGRNKNILPSVNYPPILIITLIALIAAVLPPAEEASRFRVSIKSDLAFNMFKSSSLVLAFYVSLTLFLLQLTSSMMANRKGNTNG